MFIARSLWYPLPGRGPQLRDALAGLAQPGQWVAVTARLSGPVAFAVNRRFDDLRAFQASLERPPALPPGQLDGLLARPPERELWEVTVQASPGLLPDPPPAGSALGFTARFAYEAAPAQAAELRRLVEEFTQARNAAGARSSTWVLVAGGPQAVVRLTAHADLAALEATRAAALADPAVRAFAQAVAPLLAGPAQAPELFQIIAATQ